MSDDGLATTLARERDALLRECDLAKALIDQYNHDRRTGDGNPTAINKAEREYLACRSQRLYGPEITFERETPSD